MMVNRFTNIVEVQQALANNPLNIPVHVGSRKQNELAPIMVLSFYSTSPTKVPGEYFQTLRIYIYYQDKHILDIEQKLIPYIYSKFKVRGHQIHNHTDGYFQIVYETTIITTWR